MDSNITLDGIFREYLERGIVVVNSSHQVICMDDVAARLLSADIPLPASLDALPSAIAKTVKNAFVSSPSASAQQVLLHSNNGSETSVTVETTPISLGNGASGILVKVSSVQEQGALQSQVRHFERLARLGVLSAGLAHELRNALVALSTMADLLIEEQKDHEIALTVRRELDRANELAVRMLRYARPHPQSRRPVSAHQILDRALNLAHPRFRETGTIINKALQASPDFITADEAQIEQLFLNLLINAADSINESGEVNLTTEIMNGHPLGRVVRIEVKDTGTGIPTDILPNLFQPFFTTKKHGTGLGLYLAQQIVNEHSGTIEVNSTPNEGTCVHVYLPICSD